MPQEYKLILKYADEKGYTPDVECYVRHGGYEVLKKALAMQAKDFLPGKWNVGWSRMRPLAGPGHVMPSTVPAGSLKT